MKTEISCLCGYVTLQVSALPKEVTECNCSVCHPYGVLWAYYNPQSVELPSSEVTEFYQRVNGTIEFHRCKSCGNVTHWKPIPPRDQGRLGINARLFSLSDFARFEIRHLDGAVTEKYID